MNKAIAMVDRGLMVYIKIGRKSCTTVKVVMK